MPDGSGETWLAIHEVYYDENLTSIGGPTRTVVGYTEKPITVEGETIEEVRQILLQMLEALDAPILEYQSSR
jgi:hypothetical protein